MPKPIHYDDYAYRRRRARLRKQGDPCHLCHLAIDLSLPQYHPMSWEADHVIPVGAGGDLRYGEIRASHRKCNAAKGDGSARYLNANGAKPATDSAGSKLLADGFPACRFHKVGHPARRACPHPRDW